MLFEKKTLLGLDIGSHSIKMVDLEKTRGKYELKSLGLGMVPAECIVDKDIMDSETVVETIKNLRDDETVDHRGVERVVDEIYDELGEEGLATADIIADFTGGTKAMTCGMIMACLDEGRDCQYVPQDEQQRMHPPILIQVTPDP